MVRARDGALKRARNPELNTALQGFTHGSQLIRVKPN
jgi:hypothetical protein